MGPSFRDLEKAKTLAAINALAQRFPPGTVVEIPPDGALEPAFEAYLRFPAKLAAGLRRADGAPEIVTRAGGHKSAQTPSRTRPRHLVLQDVTYRLDISPG